MKHETTCRTARATLEASLAGEELVAAVERRAAEDHVRNCADCQQQTQHDRDWDERLRAVMVDVPIPSGLQSRLQSLVTAPVSPVVDPPLRVRSWRRSLVVALTLLLMAGGLWGVQVLRQPQFSLADLDRVPAPSTLGEFSGAFELRLPQSWQSSFRFAPHLAKGYAATQRVWSEPLAVIPFQFRTQRPHEPIQGHLLVVRRSNFKQPPPPGDFTTSEIRYSQRGSWIVWSEGDLVFACTAYSGPAGLEHLRWLMAQSRSLS